MKRSKKATLINKTDNKNESSSSSSSSMTTSKEAEKEINTQQVSQKSYSIYSTMSFEEKSTNSYQKSSILAYLMEKEVTAATTAAFSGKKSSYLVSTNNKQSNCNHIFLWLSFYIVLLLVYFSIRWFGFSRDFYRLFFV